MTETIESLLALSDAELTERVAVGVMGWRIECNKTWYVTTNYPRYHLIADWNPLCNYNDTHAVIEQKREEWAKGDRLVDKATMFRMDTIYTTENNRFWRVAIFNGWGEFLVGVRHPSFARAVCVAAALDSLREK